jgi:hypothetical protein
MLELVLKDWVTDTVLALISVICALKLTLSLLSELPIINGSPQSRFFYLSPTAKGSGHCW